MRESLGQKGSFNEVDHGNTHAHEGPLGKKQYLQQ